MVREEPVVLVVEDDPTNADLLREILEFDGYRVESAADGAAALARLEVGGIDLVLLDVLLPELNGLELCQRLRAEEGGHHLPVIMLTVLSRDVDRHAALVAGADECLNKPFDLDELLDTVARHSRQPGTCQA